MHYLGQGGTHITGTGGDLAASAAAAHAEGLLLERGARGNQKRGTRGLKQCVAAGLRSASCGGSRAPVAGLEAVGPRRHGVGVAGILAAGAVGGRRVGAVAYK